MQLTLKFILDADHSLSEFPAVCDFICPQKIKGLMVWCKYTRIILFINIYISWRHSIIGLLLYLRIIRNQVCCHSIQIVTLKAFYPLVLLIHFSIAQHIFSTIEAGGYSWVDYIYSLPMRYTTIKPFVISIVSTVLASQLLPFLPTNNLEYYYSRRQFYLPSKSALKGEQIDQLDFH